MPSIYPNDYRTVIAALVKARKEKRITQVQLALAMRVSQSVISKAERCERRLDIVEIMRICELLGVSVSSLTSAVPERFSAIGSDELAD
ncbi:helix-turn-helix transcriptional regulator [Mixta calida]|uniref:helix-turn-helix domain-containing protein n=1 Tax=Mixta calida TaxID=665913 RepID=UPI002911A057|nr:helix-turn-helix transcriptional regulator [Mixta calida]MDU4291136.1 helix-turn-helix transcriptional regulator [Mixta calida]